MHAIESPAPDFSVYRDRPVDLARDVLGISPWSHQRTALDALVNHRRVSWRSCHGIGKTVTAVTAAIWFVLTRDDALVILLAPTYRQVAAVLWRTLSKVVRGAKVPLGGELLDSPERGWRFDDGRLVVGFSAGDAERVAGFHAKNVLVITDEASGMDVEIMAAIKGALTGAGILFMIGNPTKTSGEFYDSFTRKAHLYHCLHTSAFDSPNLTGAEPAIPGGIDRPWIDELAADYGAESAVYAIRGLGEFAQQAADCVISIAIVEGARERYNAAPNAQASGRLEVGVDVARFGDDASCIAFRRGQRAYPIVELRHLDVATLAQRVAHLVNNERRANEIPIVRVDTVGVGGGVADILRSSTDFEVRDINAGAAANSDTYQRCRDELWFVLKNWLRDGGELAPDPKLEGELIAPTYGYSPTGKLVVESKDDLRKRLKRSPDRADALALACYEAKHHVTLGTGPIVSGLRREERESNPLLDEEDEADESPELRTRSWSPRTSHLWGE